jgi:hypothetical protein
MISASSFISNTKSLIDLNTIGELYGKLRRRLTSVIGTEVEALLCVDKNLNRVHCIAVFDVNFNLLFISVMVVVTESGKTVRSCKMFVGDNIVFLNGYGYICFKKLNSQEIHQEEDDCQVQVYVSNSFGTEDGLETEVCTRQVERKLELMVFMRFEWSYADDQKFESSNNNFVLADGWLYNVFLKKFHRARVFTWLLVLLSSVELLSIMFDAKVSKEVTSYYEVIEFGRMIMIFCWSGSLSVILVHTPFLTPPGGQIKSTIHTIEHPAVSSGQRSPSSSEDG